MGDLKDILSEHEEQTNEDELVRYLNGSLSEAEKHAFEIKTSNSDFVNDAVDGLNQFRRKEQLNEYVEQLNKNLHKQLDLRKKKKAKRKIKDNPWIWLAVILILGLIIIAFVIIRMRTKADTLKTGKYSVERHLNIK